MKSPAVLCAADQQEYAPKRQIYLKFIYVHKYLDYTNYLSSYCIGRHRCYEALTAGGLIMVTRRQTRSRRAGSAGSAGSTGSTRKGGVTTNRTTAQRPTTRTVRKGSGKKSSGTPQWVWWVGGIAVSIIISLVISLNNKSHDNADVQKEMIDVVQTFPDYATHADYYKKLVQQCHQAAFEATYTMSRRRQSAKLDVEKYVQIISEAMAKQAQQDGEKEVANTLLLFNARVKEL